MWKAFAELEALGAEPRVEACDVTDPLAVRAVLASVPGERPLTAVVHAAGVLDDATIESLSIEQVDRVFLPKVDAALVLDELTAGMGLAAFVVFSSVAGTLGTPGQGNYAAANVFLDALAQRRRARGRATTSLAWGPWEGAGMMRHEGNDLTRARMGRVGITDLTEERGLALFDAAVQAGKLKPADRESWEARYDRAPDVISEILASIAPNTAVPVAASTAMVWLSSVLKMTLPSANAAPRLTTSQQATPWAAGSGRGS